MTVYRKVAGVWQPATQVYVKRSGIQTLVTKAYVKRSGVWVQAFTYDIVPPDPPELTTEIIDNIVKGKLIGRWIRVGVRGGTVSNPDLKRIRVLTTYNGAMPTNHDGGTYTAGADADWPSEPWSEWQYDGSHAGKDTTLTYKQWPRNAKDSVTVKAGTDYHFAAWSQDVAGNWSAAVSRTVSIPKSTDAANVVVKQTRFQANSSGTFNPDGYTAGDLKQSGNPNSEGMWFYGDQINSTIGSQGTPTIRGAQILVQRENDSGSPSANVYLFHHLYRNSGEVPGTGRVLSEITNIGTIAKGESKWFQIPESFWPDMNAGLRGFGLYYRDPVKAAAFANDYSVVSGAPGSQRSGEVVVTWEEAL